MLPRWPSSATAAAVRAGCVHPAAVLAASVRAAGALAAAVLAAAVRAAGALAAAVLAASVLAGCAGWTTDPQLTLHVDSRIDRPLLVYVNGDWVGTIPAGATDATIPAGGHGGPPWKAEGRVASGTTLVTLPIPAAPAAGEGLATTAATACGTIRMTVGDPDPGPSLAPPAPGAGLQPCD